MLVWRRIVSRCVFVTAGSMSRVYLKDGLLEPEVEYPNGGRGIIDILSNEHPQYPPSTPLTSAPTIYRYNLYFMQH
jgi:hypothetical protein